MNDLGYTAIPVLHKYIRHAEQLGIDIEQALRSAGLKPADLEDNSLRIPSQQFERLLENLLARSGDPLFGLNSARYVQPGSWSLLGYITMNCATLGEAMSRIQPYEKLVSDIGTSDIRSTGETTHMGWLCHALPGETKRQLVENTLASWLLFARWLTDTQYSPCEVWFEHAQPQGTQIAAYEAIFGCPVLFEQPASALIVPNEFLDLPLKEADARLLHNLEEHALNVMSGLDANQPFPQQVKNTLRLLLRNGLPRKERVAEQFAMTARTLQRHLQVAGTSYQQILEELRKELSEHYLLRTELPVQTIACLLGFSEPRSFHRSFKSWTGNTPGEFRQIQRSH
ncbi:AraC family transcriptional regulator [Ectopseudomonas mendocina]|uniref:AraC family transcriptional regulator n=1 Tax=Ectopseudomonas mendocina TaxID=300 RepID=A0ABZ2RDT6_ECTME